MWTQSFGPVTLKLLSLSLVIVWGVMHVLTSADHSRSDNRTWQQCGRVSWWFSRGNVRVEVIWNKAPAEAVCYSQQSTAANQSIKLKCMTLWCVARWLEIWENLMEFTQTVKNDRSHFGWSVGGEWLKSVHTHWPNMYDLWLEALCCFWCLCSGDVGVPSWAAEIIVRWTSVVVSIRAWTLRRADARASGGAAGCGERSWAVQHGGRETVRDGEDACSDGEPASSRLVCPHTHTHARL